MHAPFAEALPGRALLVRDSPSTAQRPASSDADGGEVDADAVARLALEKELEESLVAIPPSEMARLTTHLPRTPQVPSCVTPEGRKLKFRQLLNAPNVDLGARARALAVLALAFPVVWLTDRGRASGPRGHRRTAQAELVRHPGRVPPVCMEDFDGPSSPVNAARSRCVVCFC